MTKLKLAVVAVVVLTGCGGHHIAAKPVARPNQLVDINKTLTGTVTVGAQKEVTTVAVRTTRSRDWVRISGACTGGGELNLTLHLPPAPQTDTKPLLFICDSHANNTDIATVQFLPDNGATGRAFVTVSPRRGQTWWVGVGVTNAPIDGVDVYANREP